MFFVNIVINFSMYNIYLCIGCASYFWLKKSYKIFFTFFIKTKVTLIFAVSKQLIPLFWRQVLISVLCRSNVLSTCFIVTFFLILAMIPQEIILTSIQIGGKVCLHKALFDHFLWEFIPSALDRRSHKSKSCLFTLAYSQNCCSSIAVLKLLAQPCVYVAPQLFSKYLVQNFLTYTQMNTVNQLKSGMWNNFV